MASLLTVRLTKGDSPSWGFRLQGGKDFGTALLIQKVIVGSPAERAGLIAGDSVIKVNNTDVFNLRHKDAQDVLLRSGNTFDMTIQRGGSTWKPSVIPTGTLCTPTPTINNISPVTKTSLAAKHSENIGAIGTGHNVSAKPFVNGTLNGGPKVVNNQYNTPLKLYSEESIAETLSAQTEVLSTGALGVNFKKNEKNYDASKSAVLSLLKEEESSPRSPDQTDHHHSSGIDSAPSPVAIAGLRHVAAPENKPQPPSPQLPPGQNICADCERLIVGVFVRIKDKNLHVECFKCSTCGTSLKNVGYYNINNKLYCDIHAKLAARNNPPAPNLIPVTVSPGGKAPANAISAALSSHPHPTPSPLSPKINQTPFSGPKPFGSVSGPLSPSTNFNSLPRSGAPLSPIAPNLNHTYSPVISTVHSVSNITWPPVQEEPELPSACPLFYPPPSQVEVRLRTHSDSANAEIEEINSMEQYQFQKYDESSYSYSGRRRSSSTNRTECLETIAESLDTQMLVENIIRSRPQSPPSTKNTQAAASEQKTKDIHKEDTKVCSETTKSDLPKQSLIENPVPQKWESQMLKALTISVDDISTSSVKTSAESSQTICESSCFSSIPTKQTSTALGSALKVAPKEPFNPVKDSIFEAVPLPEETVPYFPPENLFSVPIKQSDEQENVKPFRKKKDPNLEKIMEDLPKPEKKLSMLAALTTAPDRSFTPLSFQYSSDTQMESEVSETKTTKIIEETKVKETERPKALPIIQVQQQDDLTPSPESLPLFQGFTCSFQNKTDHSKFDIQISTTPPNRNKKSKKQTSEAKPEEEKEKKTSICTRKEIQSTERKETKSVEKKVENVLYKKPEQMVSLRKPDTLPQYQISVKENAEADIIMMEKMEKSKAKQKAETVSVVGKENHTVVKEKQSVQPNIPVIQLHSDQNTFKPVVDSRPQSCTFSPKPRSITPSMINKPPSVLPYYQANLVAQKYGPAVVNFLDPKSPAISRSPSPAPECQKSSHSLGSKFSTIRPTSPAGGPPSNPLQKPCVPTREDFKHESAKDNLTAFIPQYKERREMLGEDRIGNIGKDSRNLQRDVIYSSDVTTKQEHLPCVTFEAERRIEDTSFASDNKQNFCRIDESSSRQTADSQKSETRTNITGDTEQTTKVCEKSHLEKSEGFKKLENKSVEKSADGLVQIQRKKTVTEEIEHTQKSQEILIEKNVQHGFRHVNVPEEAIPHIQGLHVTDPNPIQSPFLQSGVKLTPPKLPSNQQVIVCKKDPEPPQKTSFTPPKFNAATLPKPQYNLDKREEKMEKKKDPPKPIKHVDPPGSSKSNQLNPNVPPSHLGAAGGRQTGAIGTAPKRGRGVLNSAQLGGRIPLCGHCHGQIRGPFITALGKIWCPNHFICATPSCRRPLQDLGFVEEHGQLYCEYCFEQYLAPVCSKCGSKIKGDCLKAIGKAFHPECFNCVHCGKLFGNSPFFLEDGSPYCETDWNEFFTTKCFACGFPVEAGDRWVEALNNNYHSQCFNCTMCKKNLEGQSFFAKGGRPYCKNHAR